MLPVDRGAGTVDHADWVDGVVCYRRTALLKGHNVPMS